MEKNKIMTSYDLSSHWLVSPNNTLAGVRYFVQSVIVPTYRIIILPGIMCAT